MRFAANDVSSFSPMPPGGLSGLGAGRGVHRGTEHAQPGLELGDGLHDEYRCIVQTRHRGEVVVVLDLLVIHEPLQRPGWQLKLAPS